MVPRVLRERRGDGSKEDADWGARRWRWAAAASAACLVGAAVAVGIATGRGAARGGGADSEAGQVVIRGGGTSSGASFIVGGSAASASSYPYAALVIVALTGATEVCSGILIQASPVPALLTSAHCGGPGATASATVYTGMTSRSAACASQAGCTQFAVDEIYVDPSYSGGVDYYGNDAAVWRLRRVAGSASLTAAPLNGDPAFPPVGAVSTAVGWGYTNQHGDQGASPTLAQTLQSASLMVLDSTACEAAYSIPTDARAGLACLGGLKGTGGLNTATCLGDSGGPHVYEGRVFGMSSFGPVVCDGGDPLAAARTAHLLPWIQAVLADINAVNQVAVTPTAGVPSLAATSATGTASATVTTDVSSSTGTATATDASSVTATDSATVTVTVTVSGNATAPTGSVTPAGSNSTGSETTTQAGNSTDGAGKSGSKTSGGLRAAVTYGGAWGAVLALALTLSLLE